MAWLGLALDAVRDMRTDVAAGVDKSPERDAKRERESPDRAARQDRKDPDSSTRARETERGHSRSRESERRTGREIAPEPQHKVVEMDLDL